MKAFRETDETAGILTLAEVDVALNRWAAATKSCTRCRWSGGLRQLCDECRASMPKAPMGVKAQKRAGALAERKMRR